MQIFSKNVTSISIIPYYLLIISGLALILLLLDLFYYKQFSYRRFLKLWWRLTFFITLIIYLILVVMTFTH
ncbi:putative lipoprotein [Lactococcus cremoris]|nr:putative lipoprotein [Lactococcus cremoris]